MKKASAAFLLSCSDTVRSWVLACKAAGARIDMSVDFIIVNLGGYNFRCFAFRLVLMLPFFNTSFPDLGNYTRGIMPQDQREFVGPYQFKLTGLILESKRLRQLACTSTKTSLSLTIEVPTSDSVSFVFLAYFLRRNAFIF